ncbi:hypothetical protein [Paenibacillus monticola]|uniref:Uncharacterized protein n=1 Tax=Paenibacillus monticola TaxID=2666075 RepID=A0A7X2HAP3_9BACL|nr:hypothetical protein [Paenibacillus monticola]MRN56642.1 hypothetical protein [Paenibacillus monticola]
MIISTRMGIAESNEKIKFFGKDRIERKVQLNDMEGKCITEEESTVDEQAFEVAAKSLVPLE